MAEIEAFHKIDDTGLSIGTQQASNLIKALTTPILWGFAKRAEIELMLKQPGCVGIRIYNAFNKNTDDKLVVVGVTEDGSEIQILSDNQPGYFVSSMKSEQEADASNVVMRAVGREDAKQLVVPFSPAEQIRGAFLPKAESFASFFSQQSVNQLLEPKDCNGINFYQILHKPIEKTIVTHLATSAQHLEEENRIKRLGAAGQYIICEKPCPNHCAEPAIATTTAPENTDSIVLAAASSSTLKISAIKYLPDWG